MKPMMHSFCEFRIHKCTYIYIELLFSYFNYLCVGRKDKLEKKNTKIKTSIDYNACVIPQSVKDLKITLI